MSMRARGQAGFTLVEALVSLFVFSLIAAGATAMLMQSVHSQKGVAEAQASLREVQTARALLEADVQQIVMRPVREADGRERPGFMGGDADTALAFVRASGIPDPSRGAPTSLSFVDYRLDDGALIRRTRSALDATDVTTSTERVILSNVEDVSFEFYDGALWRSQWIVAGGQGSLPRAVALSFTSKRYGRMRIAALVGLPS